MASLAPLVPSTAASSTTSATRRLCPSQAITQQVTIVKWKLLTRLIPTGPCQVHRALTLARLPIQKNLERGPTISASLPPTNFEQKKRAQEMIEGLLTNFALCFI